jgi:hypothetical protein
MKIAALRAIEYWSFFGFSVELATKAKTNYKAHDNTSWATRNLIPLDEGLVPIFREVEAG